MKRWILSVVLLTALPGTLMAERLQPYVLAGIDHGTLAEVQEYVEKQLLANEFEIVGHYSPAEDESLSVICITHDGLDDRIAATGGLRGFSAVLRVGLRQTDDGVEVSFTNPLYWGNAYWQKDFPACEETYQQIDRQLRNALAGLPDSSFEPFGSKKGLTPKQLRKYHYMIAMPHFQNVVVLDKGSSFEDAVERIESRAEEEDSDIRIVYAVKYPEAKVALFGTALTGVNGEKKFLPKIDTGEPRHVPFLPYELLVLEDRVVSLHGKYRIALSFPDLGMGTFMKIVSTPGDIANAQRAIAAADNE